MSVDKLCDDKLAAVQRFVKVFRAQRGDKVTPGSKPEGSCIMQGEGVNLLYRQLIPTTESTGNWGSLQDDAILDLAYQQVVKDAYCIEREFIESNGSGTWEDWMSE